METDCDSTLPNKYELSWLGFEKKMEMEIET